MNRLLEDLFGFAFADPWCLPALLLVPLALWLRSRWRRPAIGIGAGMLLHSVPDTWRVVLRWVPAAMLGLGLLLGVLALARPVARDRIPMATEGIDVMLAIDVSSSMSIADLEAGTRRTRLDVVKETARRFVEGRAHDRIGLLLFAAFPEIRCPLTLDARALQDLLAAVQTVAPRSEEDRTGIGLGVARAARVLRGSAARSKVVILLTDGQENVWEIPPEEAAKLAKEFGVRIYTIGAGRGVPHPFGGVQEIDFSEVQRVAEVTGGRFFRAADAQALLATFEEIDRLEKTELDDPRFRTTERFLLFLLPALAAIAAAWLLESTVFAESP